MSSVDKFSGALIGANPHTSRYNPLCQISFSEGLDEGVNGWCEFVSKLDSISSIIFEMRPSEKSNVSIFDNKANDTVDGICALKLATRSKEDRMRTNRSTRNLLIFVSVDR